MALVRVRFTVEENYAGWRLDRYLREKIRRLSRERVQALIETRLEHDGPGRLKPSTRIAPGLTFALLRVMGEPSYSFHQGSQEGFSVR